MGQQQILLIILGIIITAVAISVGIAMFSSNTIGSNKDALVNDLANLAANSYQYKLRLKNFGGGGGTYTGYTIPDKLRLNDDGSFTVSSITATSIIIVGTSGQGFGTITLTVDSLGKPTTFVYSGDFL